MSLTGHFTGFQNYQVNELYLKSTFWEQLGKFRIFILIHIYYTKGVEIRRWQNFNPSHFHYFEKAIEIELLISHNNSKHAHRSLHNYVNLDSIVSVFNFCNTVFIYRSLFIVTSKEILRQNNLVPLFSYSVRATLLCVNCQKWVMKCIVLN